MEHISDRYQEKHVIEDPVQCSILNLIATTSAKIYRELEILEQVVQDAQLSRLKGQKPWSFPNSRHFYDLECELEAYEAAARAAKISVRHIVDAQHLSKAGKCTVFVTPSESKNAS